MQLILDKKMSFQSFYDTAPLILWEPDAQGQSPKGGKHERKKARSSRKLGPS
jgi:hypothetical protein